MPKINRLKLLRESNGRTQLEIAEKLGITSQAYCNYELGKRDLKSDTLLALSRIYDVSTDYLLGNTDELTRYPASESIPEFESGKKRRAVMIPVLAEVRAGFGHIAGDYYEDEIAREKTYNLKNPDEYYYFRVKGKSMQPFILEDDLALVHCQQTIENGQIGVVLLNGEEGMIKKIRLRDDNTAELISFNPSYPPVIIDRSELIIWGRVVETVRKLS